MKKKIAFGLILLCIVLWYAGNGAFSGSVVEKQEVKCKDCNVVFIVVDTLRADHLSCYGYPYNTSPVIDSLASESVVFENAFSQIPFTPPSHWSMMTGLYPFRHRNYLPQDEGRGLKTLAETLKENGYSTAAFVSSFMVRGIKSGFDVFDLPMKKRKDNPRFKAPRNATETTKKALEWLEKNSKGKFFLFVHYFDVHSPYRPPEEFDVFNYSGSGLYEGKRYDSAGVGKGSIRDNIAKYDGEILYVDSHIGKILGKLKELGLENNTVVVVTSDHGECFGEHTLSEFGYESEKPCIFHGKTLFEEEVHVPLIVKVPGLGKGRVKNIVESVDIMPGLLRLLDIPFDGDIDGRGLGLCGDESGKGYSIMQTLPRSDGSYSIAMRNMEWKFVRMCKRGNGDCAFRELLFAVPQDRSVNAKTNAGIIKEMERTLDGELGDVEIGPVNFTISRSLKERLRRKGYIA